MTSSPLYTISKMGCGPSSIQSPEEETIEKPKNSVPPTHAKSKSNSTTPVQKSVSTTTPTTSTKPAATHHVPIEKQVQSPKNTHGPHPTRKSSINTPNLQTVKETKTPGDEAFSEQETHSLHRKHSHRSSQYHSVDSTALSNSSVDKSKDVTFGHDTCLTLFVALFSHQI